MSAAADLRERVGLAVEPWRYEVGAEKIREYATAVGETSPIYYDREAARSEGFRDVVAPPTFAVVYCRWMSPVIEDPRFGIDYDRMLHGSQGFEWGPPVCAGDTVTTSARLTDAFAKGPLTFYEITSSSRNQDDVEVVEGKWTMIVRGEE